MLWALVVVMGGLLVWAQFAAPTGGVRFEVNETYGDAPSFQLIDQLGNDFSSDELKGKVWLANFIYTRCVDECPRMTGALANVADILERDRLLGERVRIVSISVDPEYDTAERLDEYAGRFGTDPRSWHFLTGDREYIEELLTQGFHVTMINRPIASLIGGVAHAHAPEGSGIEIIHSERVVVVDQDGAIRAYVDGLQTPPEDIAAKVRELL